MATPSKGTGVRGRLTLGAEVTIGDPIQYFEPAVCVLWREWNHPPEAPQITRDGRSSREAVIWEAKRPWRRGQATLSIFRLVSLQNLRTPLVDRTCREIKGCPRIQIVKPAGTVAFIVIDSDSPVTHNRERMTLDNNRRVVIDSHAE